ncbi:hypothetical protein [Macrococcoides caseolyticum]|uniref:hypothetical protein n=1 Tax=Macrococcoides caseolyticum TaxID=69966 RepID=UPI0024BCE2E0|nr:hypothetical protein [Macrococcus caseolyticus]MDJ1089952.1 hypothetical protein [Macrococcus caseolyticus]
MASSKLTLEAYQSTAKKNKDEKKVVTEVFCHKQNSNDVKKMFFVFCIVKVFIEVSARRTPSKGRDRSVLPQAKPKG